MEAFTADLFLEPARKGLAVLLLLLGMMLSAGSAVRWLRGNAAGAIRRARSASVNCSCCWPEPRTGRRRRSDLHPLALIA